MASVRRSLLSVLIVAVVTECASADLYLWCQQSSDPAPIGLPSIRTLTLDPGFVPLHPTWSVDVYMYATENEQSTAYSIRFYRPLPTGTADTQVSATSFQYAYADWSVHSPLSPPLNNGNYLIQSCGQARSAGETILPVLTPTKMAHLELSIADYPENLRHTISMAVGPGRFAHLPSGYVSNVYFGDSEPVSGATVSALGNVPVINIRPTPEPATLALFSFGVVGLLRRR